MSFKIEIPQSVINTGFNIVTLNNDPEALLKIYGDHDQYEQFVGELYTKNGVRKVVNLGINVGGSVGVTVSRPSKEYTIGSDGYALRDGCSYIEITKTSIIFRLNRSTQK